MLIHVKKLKSVKLWIILIYLFLFGSNTQARSIDQYYDLESLVRPTKDGGDSPDFSTLDITTPPGHNPMGRVLELKDLTKFLSQNLNEIQTAEILDGNVKLHIDPNELHKMNITAVLQEIFDKFKAMPETERKLPEPVSRFYHPITQEEQDYLTEMANKIYKLFIRPDDEIPEDFSKYYRPTPSQVKAATDFINYMVAQYKKRGSMDVWQHVEVLEDYLRNHPDQVQDFVNLGKAEAIKVAQGFYHNEVPKYFKYIPRALDTNITQLMTLYELGMFLYNKYHRDFGGDYMNTAFKAYRSVRESRKIGEDAVRFGIPLLYTSPYRVADYYLYHPALPGENFYVIDYNQRYGTVNNTYTGEGLDFIPYMRHIFSHDEFESQFGPDVKRLERLTKMLSDTRKVLTNSNDTMEGEEEEDEGDFDSIQKLASNSFQGFQTELKRELRETAIYNATGTGEPLSKRLMSTPASQTEMADPERRLFGLKTLKKKIKIKKKKLKTYLAIYKITMLIIKIKLAILRIIGLIYRVASYFFNMFMFIAFSIIGFFFPKLDYTHLFITRGEHTMHDEKMSTPKPQEITYSNVASNKVLLVTGYRVTMSIVYLITALDEMSKESRWNIRKANFYTRSFRWILRHFSVWPYWLVKQGSYSNTHMLWTRRQFYNDYDIPWLVQRLIFIVPPSEWDRDGRMEHAFREQKQLGRFPMCLVTPCREHPDPIDLQPWKGVWGMLGFKG